MMVVAAVASLNVALPAIARDIGASQTQLQWIVDAYALSFAALLLPAGAIGDRFGRKPVLAFGLALFGGASLIALFAHSPAQLIGLRVLMGVGAACVMPVTLSVITTVFPPEERGKAVGTWLAEKAVAEAKAQLQHTELAIKEIAYRLGFADPAHFSTYFKKHTGLTPQQYRQLPPAA